jgi:putative transcription factor
MLAAGNTCNYFAGGAATNKQHVTTKNTAKLDRETEELKHDKIPLDLGRLIQQGRQAKGWSQKELATVGHDFDL